MTTIERKTEKRNRVIEGFAAQGGGENAGKGPGEETNPEYKLVQKPVKYNKGGGGKKAKGVSVEGSSPLAAPVRCRPKAGRWVLKKEGEKSLRMGGEGHGPCLTLGGHVLKGGWGHAK